MACQQNKNPLHRSGTSQLQRMPEGLKNGYVNIDEREYADWIMFARNFAVYLNFYGPDNHVAGNWEPFFSNDISAVLGSIAIQNLDDYREEINKRFKILKSNDLHNQVSLKKESFGALFAAVLTFSKGLDQYIVRLTDETPLKAGILNLIASRLQPSLQKLLMYYKAGKAALLVKDRDYPEWKILSIPVNKTSGILAEGLSKLWTGGTLSWSDFFNSLPPDDSIYGDAGFDPHRKLHHAVNHNLFSGLIDQFLFAYSRIIDEAEKNLLQTLSNWNQHQPHYALFLSFLKLFRFARDHANSLTQRHLDFYYKEVLQLLPKGSEPNHVHVIMELAKHVDEFLLKEGTLFKAGKDDLGKPLLYRLDKDVVINKARVAQLKSVYKGRLADNIGGINNEGRLFVSPVSNSADGLGAKLQSASKEWHPYVNKKYADGMLTGISMPRAVIGFAVASSNLYLTEGERLVQVKFSPAFTSAQMAALTSINCYLTTKKGWYQTKAPSWSADTLTGSKSNCSVLSFSIPGDGPAISDYVQKVHGGLFEAQVPLLKILLKNEDTSSYTYDILKDIALTDIEVEVRVGMNEKDTLTGGGLKNLVLSNDSGAIDPAKPFLPFGNAPRKGASLIIGNDEVFKKNNAALQIKLEWMDLPGTLGEMDYDTTEGANYPKASLDYLAQGKWKNLATIEIFDNLVSEVTIPPSLQSLSAGNNEVMVPYTEAYLPFSVLSKNGFIRLSLTGGFGYDEYLRAYTVYLINLANKVPNITEPKPPYTPRLKSVSVHYKATSAVNLTGTKEDDFNKRDIRFFHLYPFGEAEQHQYLNGSPPGLMPQFVSPENPSKSNAGEFYIGVEALAAGQGVSVLFQLLEGTSDPKLDKPDKHVSWSYLSRNRWKPLSDQEVSDQTDQLVRSGIISFVIPAKATTDNTMLPPGYIWLRASVTEKAEAVCKLLSVQAQAAVLTFKNMDNSPGFLNAALPAGSISKLLEAESAIKKIEQPYASFGGRPPEDSQHYYIRVSERLRHKARAITIWDYEHLILEAFPGIHKVKCLNHTRFIENDYNETAPGHVTVITIPVLLNRNDANPLRPYTSQDVLNEIEVFLQRKISCHVKVKVRHPQFEEVRLDFSLKLNKGLEFNFYRDLLRREITEFLTPWAFGKAAEVEFGGRVHKSVLINFIEERSYVDYITDVKMYHRIDENLSIESADTDMIEASTAKSILVSAPANKHAINELTEIPSTVQAEDCVDEFNTESLPPHSPS